MRSCAPSRPSARRGPRVTRRPEKQPRDGWGPSVDHWRRVASEADASAVVIESKAAALAALVSLADVGQLNWTPDLSSEASFILESTEMRD